MAVRLEKMKEIKITCEAKELVDIDKIESIQGELKEFSKEGRKKLRESLINNGVSFPSFVWVNDGKYYSIDGWHRKIVIAELKREGWKTPPKIPVAHIHAKNIAHAKKLLLLASSRYAEIKQSEINSFLDGESISDLIKEVDIPNVEIFIPGITQIEEEEIKPYKAIHWLISIHPSLYGKVKKHIEEIEKIDGVEIEQGQN